jgi:hypothetical protein
MIKTIRTGYFFKLHKASYGFGEHGTVLGLGIMLQIGRSGVRFSIEVTGFFSIDTIL